jgi:hypothetical protein
MEHSSRNGKTNGRQHMYLWLWRHLPGGVTSKLVYTAILAVAAAALLWFIVFPWLTPQLPLDQVMPH